MTHLNEDGNVVCVLYNLNVVVVGRGSDRRSRALQNETALRYRPVFRAIEFMTSICRQPFALSFAAVAFIGGTFPSFGSMTSDVRLVLTMWVPRSHQKSLYARP